MKEIAEIAAATTAILAPFMPLLMDAGKVGGKKLVEVVITKSGEAAWAKAQGIWNLMKAKFTDTPVLQGAAMMLAHEPEDETYQMAMAKSLGNYLRANPQTAKELLAVIGGRDALQEVLAERGSLVEGVAQDMSGAGKQVVEARDFSVIKDVRQSKE